MIFGVGCDLCSTKRIQKSLQGPHRAAFAAHVFSQEEQALLGLGAAGALPARAVERAAANFAAKEAFLKAAGTGLGGFSLPEIALLRQKSGAPYYACTGKAAAWLAENGVRAHVSVSHEGGQALAFCVLERAEA